MITNRIFRACFYIALLLAVALSVFARRAAAVESQMFNVGIDGGGCAYEKIGDAINALSSAGQTIYIKPVYITSCYRTSVQTYRWCRAMRRAMLS